jgi:hypothetical protein
MMRPSFSNSALSTSINPARDAAFSSSSNWSRLIASAHDNSSRNCLTVL